MLALSTTFEQLTCPIPAIAVLIGSRDLGTNSETSDWDITIWRLDDKQPGNTERLRQSILKKAFSGQLVAQNANDEPANELLERIQKSKTKRL